MIQRNQSEIARLLEQIDAEHAAAEQGLQGIAAGATKHQYMTARAERIAGYQQQLAGIVGSREALRLIIEHQTQETTTSL